PLTFPQQHLPHTFFRLARREHLMPQLLGVALDVRDGGPVVEQHAQLAAALEPAKRVFRPRPGDGAKQAAEIENHYCSAASSSSYCLAESSSPASLGEDISI